MAVAPAGVATGLERGPATTTDLLKAAGLAFVLVDHLGLFFVVDDGWWRVFGRPAAPIFFFLIGFARSREVPWTWFVLGLGLTALDHLTSSSASDTQLNLLLSFALLRAGLPAFEAHVAAVPARMALALGIGVALLPVLGPFLEYGAEGWLWATFGLAQRRASESRADGTDRIVRVLAGLVAATAYWGTERADFGLDGAQSAVLAGLVAALALTLGRFSRREVGTTLPAPLATALRVCGRRSLEIYAVGVFAMQVLGYAVHGPEGEEADNAGDT